MTTHQKRAFRPKKLSFNETHFSVKATHSPDASNNKKFLQTKTNIFQASGQSLPFTTLNSPTTFSLILNGNTIKLDQLKSPKSVKLASFRLPTTGKTSKSPMTLNEISPSPSPSFREPANRRIMKSQSTAPKTNPELICPPINNPEMNVSSSFRKSFLGSADLMTMLNSKTEELDSLQRNVYDLQVKVNSLASVRQEHENEIESVMDLEKELYQKDQMIEIYTKLLNVFSKGSKGVSSTERLSTQESPKKGKSLKTVRVDTNWKQPNKVESHPNSGSFTTFVQKSTHPTTSPVAERNDSRLNSRITEQESNASKEDILSLSPSYRLNTKDSSRILSKDSKDFKLKVLKSIYGTEIRSAGKTGLSHILNDVTGDTRKLNRTDSQEPEIINSTPSIQEIAKRSMRKTTDGSIEEQLANFVGKLDTFFSKYEDERKKIMKKNEEMIEKLEQLATEKTKRAEIA